MSHPIHPSSSLQPRADVILDDNDDEDDEYDVISVGLIAAPSPLRMLTRAGGDAYGMVISPPHIDDLFCRLEEGELGIDVRCKTSVLGAMDGFLRVLRARKRALSLWQILLKNCLVMLGACF